MSILDEKALGGERLELFLRMLDEEGIVGAPGAEPIPRREGAADAPASFAQRRLWLVDRLEPGSAAYNVPVFWRLRGTLDAAALGRALSAVADRHEALRTTFAERQGEPVQVVAPAVPISLAVDDLTALDPAARLAEAERRAADEAARPFDLAAGPLLRARLLRLAADDHVLLLTLHHAVCDAWSLTVVFRELSALYDAERSGIPAALAPLPLQYGDYAAWQRSPAQVDALREAMGYWRAKLAGAPPLQLPADRPRPAALSDRGGGASLDLGGDATAAARALARREGATPFAVLLSAFAVLAGRWARQDDVVVGMAVAGRTRRELEPLAGNFVNLLALRADLAGDPTGRELIARVSSVVTEALERQEVPFERLVEVVQPDRALGRTPLAQVAFGYQDASERALRLAGLVAEPFRAEAGTTHFDLTLNVIDQDGRLRAECLYSTDLFDTETIDRFLAQFATVLAALAAGPEMRISALPLVGRAERARLLAAGAASAPEQETATLHERFASRAARTPHAVAITCEDESLTYGELDARANRLARHLQALGVGPETRVGLCVERSAEMVVAILGVLKAGGAYVPLDPAHPAERLAYVIDDAGIGILLTQERLLETLPASSAELVCLDRDWPVIAALTGDAPASAVVPGNTAYVIYTSGSTGKPKGCAVTHANVTRLFSATDAWFGFGEADVWTLFHSVAFDFSVWEIWGALLYGGRLVVVPYLTSRSPDEFHALLEREGVTVLSQTPSAFRQLARVDEDAAVSADARPLALRLVVFGGEALEPASLRGWVARHGDAAPRLVNMYGITETTVHVTYRPITRAEVEGGSSSVIGIPIPDLPLHLLDARGEPAPVGVPGEIHVGGAGVSRGYLGRPSLTAQRFVPDPFSGVPGARLYRSGDLARRRSDGDLEYLGRIDEQVKVRGFRIEPGEIEAVLAAHPAVGESVVLVAEDEPGDRQLVAFVAACNGHAPEWPELRAFLRASLPDALVPAACVVVDALPLTPNGKVDRRALLALDREGRAADHGFVAPRTPTEETLAGVWRGVLGIERIGVHESFFALGGDSIRAIRVLSGARERGVPLTLAQLFAHQTVAELAAELGGAADDPVPFVRTAPFSLVSPEDRLRLPPVVEDAYPLARMQAGMLYHAALDPDHPVYHNLNSFHLSLGWDEGCFRRAVAAVVERHPILRTGFAMEEFEEPLQLVHRSAVLELGVSDLRALPADAQERELAAHRDAELARPFDLARPTLLRFHVHRLSDGGFQFTLTECHAILDGWSLTSTLAELFELYAALLAGHPLPDAAPLEVSFRDFVDMERRALESPACRDFWEGRLRGAVPRRIPRLPRPEADGRRLEALDIHVPDEVHRALRRLEREEGLPLKTLLLAAHLKVLSLLQGGREVISGLAMNGRPEVEGGDRIRGLFLNTVPFRAELEPGSWAALARRVLQAEREILPFRRYPVSALHEGRRLEPLFEASFNFVHFHRLGDFLKTAAVEARGGLWERADTNFTLVASFGVGMVTGGLRLFLACDRAELSDEQVETAAALYPAVLRAIAGHPHARHDGGDLLGGALLTRVVAEGIGPVAAVGPRGLHRVLERRAAATPDAPAVACGAERLSYAALDRRASRIARQLRALGVGAETRVAVCVPRSADRVAAILGVLKAGGTALPLDPDASPRRRAETAAALEARVMVTRDGTRADGFATLALDLDTVAVSAESPAASDVFVPPGALALVLAVPEPRGGVGGVLLPHAAMASTAAALAGELGAGEGTRWALAAPAGSPLEVLELFAALAAGAELHFAPPAHAEELESFLLESDAGAAVLPPAALARLSPERLPSLTAVAVHGAVCPAGVAAEWGPGGRLVSAFGPAEAGMLALAERLDGASPPLSTGRPVANARVHVLDDALDPVAAGVAGEVCVGGDGVARGYAGRPGLTAERFVPDAWSGEPGARLFRTGARGRRLGGGAVELLDLAEPALAWDEAEPADEDDLAAVPLPPVVATGRTGLLPLSFAQERLWFLDRMEPGSALYNVPAALRLRGALDAHALERALGEIVRRHEALRTTFREEDDAPVQVVAPFDGFTLHLDDLSSLDEAKREAELARRVDGETTLPFDLSAGPLLRARLLRLGGEEHVLLLCMHHIVSDGWSLRVLYRELWALYAAYRGGAESPLPELAVQYADYAAWQREHLRGRALDRQLAWWKEQLAGAPALLELPTDRPRPAVQTHRGGQVALDLPGDAVERLRALGRSEGATPFMVLLAAVQVLLGRYTGTDDVVVGSPMAGRTQEVEGLIGFFANTLVLRTDLSGDPGFREVLQRVRGVTLGAGEHQAVPFEKVVEALQPERSLGRSPLFQVMVQMAGAFVPATVATGMSAERVELRNGTTRFDLTFAFVEREDGVRGVLDYATDLFDDATAERMARHLALLLEQVADDPDLAISRASLADEAERARLQAWSGTDAEDASAGFVHRRFAEQAARTPDAVAVTHRGDLLTYRELDARSNRLAHHLRGRGIASETAVGICLERTPEMVVAVLAVLKAGGAYVPLDPSYPADRLAFMLEDAGVALVVTQESLRARLPALAGVELLSVDGLREALAAKDDAPVDGGADGRGLAYVIYTSGSTGRPKGVAVEHGGLAAYLDWACRTYPGRGSAVHSSLSFDLTVTSLFVPLLGGGCVDLVEEAAGVDGLAARFRSGGVHGMLKLTPAHLRLLGEQLNRADLSAGPECLVVGGEALLGEHLELWKRRLPDTVVVNEYGPTETVVGCCIHVVRAGDAEAGRVPIGRPSPGTRLYVLDANGLQAPAGIPGELYIGGAQVARGYVGRPSLTAERFVPDPFSGRPGARLYRTGDRARWMESAEVRECGSAFASAREERTPALPHSRTFVLDYLGRLDEQVKVRGFRVEPGEIEAVLRRHPQVADCAVVAREDAPGDVRLVAYVVGSADPETLKAHLRLSLPEHMVPADFVALDALPLTTNGKLDRRALSAPEPAVASSFVAPRTEVEETIAGIWAKVLRRDQVGVHDNFLEIGGHSLLATRVVSRIRAAFGLELPLRALLEAPTLADLAVGVEALRGASPAPVAAVVRTGRTGPLPLSFAQERLWFLDRMALGSALYNLPAALRLRGALDAPALERALGEVARRHEALRTTFSEVDGSPAQSVVPFAGFALAVEDLSAAGEADREAAVQRRAAEEAARPFDLAAGPHFRARLLRLAGEEHVLLLCMHHIVSDGWSMGVLFCELWALYAAYRDGAESPLLELPVQYADYAAWQREQLQGEALDRQLAYWKDRLAGAPAVLELPTDHPHPPVQSHRGALARIDLPGAALKRLQALGRSEGATPFMVLLGAVQLLLSKYAGTDDVVVGSPIAGRTQREVEGLVGFFVNTLVLRTDLSGDPSFREVLRRVRDVTLSAYEHQAVPFEKLVEALQPERSLSHSPLFQVMVQMESGSAAAAPDGLRLDRVGFAIETTKFDLTVAFAEDERGTHGVLGYAADLFEPATAERMARHLAFLLERVADDPDLPVSRASLLGEAERARVLHEWSGTDAEGTAALVHRRFADQAARTPDAVAVTHRAGTVTYRELDARANRLARHLRRRGVSADVRVGLCLERTPEMVVAVLAVLKAGGAYVPLDPSYPAERLTFMLDDAGAALVLTQESLRSALPATAGVEILSVDGQRAAIAAEDDAPVDGGAEGRSLAYVIYTSGSTGRPKGVGVEHGGLAAYLDWACATYPGRGSAVHSSLSFDLTVTSLFVPLLGGGCVELVEEEEGVDGLAARLRDGAGYPVLKLTPAHLRFLGEQLDGRELGVGAECLVVGGEALLGEHLELWWQRLPHTLVVNEYGPTETVVGCCIHAVRAGDAGAGRVPIGRPVPGTRLYVLDAGGLPAPAGVSGELYIGGAQVARGYIGRPALTAERFLPDPFSGRPGARLYRTGDRARWTESAVLDYLGRLDEQVKVRGFRVEPGEIEAALRRHPGVADCAVITREHAPGDVRLVAYVVGTADPETLKPHLRLTLPEHMVPADVVSLDVLPLTSNGKLDRRALPAPSGGSGRGLRPETELEGRLGTLWQEVLGIAAVGVEDNFFDLGGHSLLLARLQSRLGRELGREVPLVELFRYPTVRSLARWLQGTSTDDSAATKGEERAGIRQAVLGRLATRRTRGA